MEEPGIGGTVALAMGVVSLVLSLLSLVTSAAGGACSTCCAALGWVAALIPLAAGLFALASLLLGVVVRMRPAVNDEDKNPMYALFGILCSLIAIVVNVVSGLIASWATILAVVLGLVNVVMSALGMLV